MQASIVVPAGLIALAAAFLSHPAVAKDIPPGAAAMLPQARQEGRLNISWTAFGFNKGAERFEKGFNSYYGTKVKFDYTAGLAFGAAQRRLADELDAGKPAFRDVSLVSSAPVVQFEHQKKMDREIDWAALLPHIPKDLLAQIVVSDGRLVRVLTQTATIMYNTNVIKPAESPKTLVDLLNPKWKGMIASTPYAFGWELMPMHPLWGEPKAIDFMTKFAPQITGLIRCAELERIASGEFPIFALTCEPGLVRQLQEQGAPVDQNIPLDWRYTYSWYFGVPKHSQHPAIATLFIAWLLTPEGQAVLWENEGADLDVLPGSRNKPIFDKTAQAAGGDMYRFTFDQELTYNAEAYRDKILGLIRDTKR